MQFVRGRHDRREHARRRVIVCGFACLLVLVHGAGSVRPVGAIGPRFEADDAWVVPVDAPVVDPFRPPATRFAAGNRGIEYGTRSGDPVRAVADGRVVFAGRVGSSRHVTIDHGNGLRSTAAYLDTILVVRGASVRQGDPIATAAAGFHLTARLGDDYVDPALFFAGAEVVLRLTDAPPEPVPRRGPFDSFTAMAVAAQGLTLSGSYRTALAAVDAWAATPCSTTAPAPGTAGAGRVLIQVGGLGSSSDDAAIGDLDPETLGYAAADVVGFSYAGGCTPTPFGGNDPAGTAPHADSVEPLTSRLESSTYSADDTYGDLDESAARLADLIEAAAAARPGRPIDVAAHSLGGVVARRALELLVERPGAVRPATLVTIGSPHDGAPLATAAVAAGPDGWLGLALDRTDRVGDLLDAHSVAQVAETGLPALPPPNPPPEGVRVVSIGAATDLVVPATATVWPGATNVVVGSDLGGSMGVHGGLPGRVDVADEVARAVVGVAPGCRSLGTLLGAAFSAGLIDGATDAAGVAAGVVALLP